MPSEYSIKEIIGAVEKRDKQHKRQDEQIRDSIMKGVPSQEIWTPDKAKNQPFQLGGHVVDHNYKLTSAQYLEELYEEYLRMYQLQAEQAKEGQIMRTSYGTIVNDMSFEDYLHESKKTLEWRKDKELPLLFKRKQITKENIEFFKYHAVKQIEAIDKYLNAPERQRIAMV